MKRYGVCPSVCPIRPLQQRACGRFAAVGPAVKKYRSIAARRAAANAGNATFSEYVGR